MKRIVYLPLALLLMCFTLSSISNGQHQSSDIPLKVRIEGNPNTYTTASPYQIIGDGVGTADQTAGVYEDGKDGVYARFQIGNGTNDFIMDPTDRRVTAPRTLYFDFTNRISPGTVSNPWYGLGLVKIDTYLNFDQVYTVPVGGTLRTNGGFGQLITGNQNYRVAFNPDPSGPNFNILNTPNYTAPLVVTHPDCNTWEITPDVVAYNQYDNNGNVIGSGIGAVSGMFIFATKSSPIMSTGQYLMPFRITLTRKTPISCP